MIIYIYVYLLHMNELKYSAYCRETNDPYIECSDYRRCVVFNAFTPKQLKNMIGSLNSSVVGELESFDILESHVQVLQPTIFERFNKDLKHFAVLQSGVEAVHKNTFARLSKLETMELSENLLSTVEHAWLKNLSQLSHLYLNGNNISFVESNAFNDLTNLRILHLELNSISHLDKLTFIKCEKLFLLDLSHNKLTTLVLNFPNNALTYLDLSKNQLWQAYLRAQQNWICKENEELHDVQYTSSEYSEHSVNMCFHQYFGSRLKLIADSNNLKGILLNNISVHTLNLIRNPVNSMSFLGGPAYKYLIHLWIPYIKHLTDNFNWEAVPYLESIHIPSAQLQSFPLYLSPYIKVLDLDSNEIEFVNSTEVLIKYPRLHQLHLRDNDLPCDRLTDLIIGFANYGVQLFLHVGKTGEMIHSRPYLVKFWVKYDTAVICLTQQQRKAKHQKFNIYNKV